MIRLTVALALWLVACGDDASSSEGSGDAGADAGDVAPPACENDDVCDDGTFCNGRERCEPDAEGGDARGCLRGVVPCREGQRCEEGEDRCVTLCQVERDADDDGQEARECGGLDCDDADARRYSGNDEECDQEHVDEDCNPLTFGVIDEDEDGFASALCCNANEDGELAYCGDDCDDEVENVNPDVTEVCDSVDNDCDGMTDEGVSVVGYLDADYDKHGDPDFPMVECAEVTSFEPLGDDCNDREATVHGAQSEICDGVDNDCDGDIDEDPSAVSWYRNRDGDPFGDSDDTEESCAPLEGYSILPGDCDDSRADVSRAALETCDGVDNDCDDEVDEGQETSGFVDVDGDGFGSAEASGCPGVDGLVLEGGDCDDEALGIYPGQLERCDDVDEDCDGEVDEGVLVTGFADRDHDLRGDPDAPREACAGTPGLVVNEDDCDDDDPTVHRQQAEICDDVDNDCDDEVDEEAGPATWYPDTDGDGFGDPAGVSRQACLQPEGHSILPFDCDDGDDAVFPGAEERCDGQDNDCNGMADFRIEAGDLEDDDGDGHTDAECEDGDDCDDDVSATYAGAPELCDDLDNDCDEDIDEDASEIAWYPDLDRDGFGDDGASPVASCEPVIGHVSRAGDCDDSSPAVRPGTSDGCDGIDRDCDGELDEDAGNQRYYADLDGDGSAGSTFVVACASPGAGHKLVSADCDDDDPDRKPGAHEACDGEDDDCDGETDEGARLAGYADLDGDLHGDADSPLTACAGSAGFSLLSDDCDDGDVTVHGAQLEVCDDVDNDCDEDTDEDTQSVTWYADDDGDGFGSALSGTEVACVPPTGHVLVPGDCDDDDDAVNRTASEQCNGRDDDCDGPADEGLRDLAPEACDGSEDEDCDGEVDEDCACVLGTARLCGAYTLGECGLGVQACGSGGAWGRCVGERAPDDEICDELDNDCDGISDEDDACEELCGNGVMDPGEACDHDTNDGSYGGCNSDCLARGPHCGDGIENGPEECDDGNDVDDDVCRNACADGGSRAVVVEQNVGEGFELAIAPGDEADDSTCEGLNTILDESLHDTLNAARPGLDMALYTVYRPVFPQGDEAYPLVVWANNTCFHVDVYDVLLRHLAASGFIVVAPQSRWPSEIDAITSALDFAFDANADPSSPYYERIDTERVAGAGHGGGVLALDFPTDERIDTLVAFRPTAPADPISFLVLSGERDIGGTTAAQLAAAVEEASQPAAYAYFTDIPMVGQVDGYTLLVTDPERVLEPVRRWLRFELLGEATEAAWFLAGECESCGEVEVGTNGL